MEGVIVADEEWLLPSICPHHAIREHKVDRAICDSCEGKECIRQHDTKGMYLSYKEETIEEVIGEACANEMMFYDGGGVTFTGGEATVQFQEMTDALKGLKEKDIHTAIETNGTHPRLPELFPYIGRLIMDCKHCDASKHQRYTGISNERIMENIRRAAKEHPGLHVRVPLIGGFNDSELEREQFLDFFREIKGDNVTFEVLSYHEFGKKKWHQCGWEYKMTDEAYVDEASVRRFRKAMEESGVRYRRT